MVAAGQAYGFMHGIINMVTQVSKSLHRVAIRPLTDRVRSWTFLTPTAYAITPTKKVGTLPTPFDLLKIAGLLGGKPGPELLDKGRVTEEWLAWLDTYAARIESEKISGEWGEDFAEAREMAAMAANLRFVMRQCLLEKVIKKVERDPAAGKHVLGKVMQRALRVNHGDAKTEGCFRFSTVVPLDGFLATRVLESRPNYQNQEDLHSSFPVMSAIIIFGFFALTNGEHMKTFKPGSSTVTYRCVYETTI
ncbi:hypothetical protein EDD15DRAFT_2367826 [Pisolithus albus]|nr:hypothetical protein EDD15DRAFT_2367826 [Pisolithus albus]